MRVYAAGISGDQQYVKSLRTFYEIRLEPGDYKQERASGRGDVARRLACEEFLSGPWDAIALLDLDMLHPPGILARLRSHAKDMVTGHYYARNGRNVHSLVCAYGDGRWPFLPLYPIPRSGLHRVGMTGMGNVLIRREVVEAVAKRLPPGDEPFGIGPAPDVTGDNRSLGSDFRFFSLAQLLGFELWLDADVESRHGVTFWLNHELADRLTTPEMVIERMGGLAENFLRESKGNVDVKGLQARIRQLETRREELYKQKQQQQAGVDMLNRQIIAVQAVINEDKWLLDQITPQAFPTVPESGNGREKALAARTGLPEHDEAEVIAAREGVLRKEAQEFTDDLAQLRKS